MSEYSYGIAVLAASCTCMYSYRSGTHYLSFTMRLCIIHDCLLNRVKIQSDRGAFPVGLSHNNLVLSTENCEYYIVYENHSV